MNKKQVSLKLFPNYFKKISFGLIAFSILILVLNKSHVPIFDNELVKEFVKVGVLVSLFLFAMTKDKVEDELTIKIRMNSFAISFIYGTVLMAIKPFTNLLFHNSFMIDISAYQLILTMLFLYFLSFYYYKKNR